jgi:hypothetical protein
MTKVVTLLLSVIISFECGQVDGCLLFGNNGASVIQLINDFGSDNTPIHTIIHTCEFLQVSMTCYGEPSGQPTGKLSGQPTNKPSGEPTGEPSGQPTTTSEPSGSQQAKTILSYMALFLLVCVVLCVSCILFLRYRKAKNKITESRTSVEYSLPFMKWELKILYRLSTGRL